MNFSRLILLLIALVFSANALAAEEGDKQTPVDVDAQRYNIAVGDNLRIFVWRNPELSVTVPVRPDGRISLPLVDDILVLKKTPVQLANEIESLLTKFIKQPEVSVIVMSFGQSYDRNIKVVGGSIKPMSIPFSENMTLLDVVIQMGGVPDTAKASAAVILRKDGSDTIRIPVDLDDLVNEADLSQNLALKQGDILLIPEKWF